MKTLHGKRHIRARRSVLIGRRNKTTRRVNQFIRHVNKNVIPAIDEVTKSLEPMYEELVKAFDTLIGRFHQSVTDNGDGTYTHTWNLEKKG